MLAKRRQSRGAGRRDLARRQSGKVRIKDWTCPGCQRSFIVDVDANRDTCPWCHATIEQRENDLKVVGEPAATDEPQPSPVETQPTGPVGSQAWWPFEFSS
jgi:hypothetical protein